MSGIYNKSSIHRITNSNNDISKGRFVPDGSQGREAPDCSQGRFAPDYHKPYIISIEGNIGTGKSTFLENLESVMKKSDSKYSNSILFLKEPVDIWESIKDEEGRTILEKFYKNKKRYSFTFQVMAYISRLTLLKRAIKENPQCKIIIIERSLIADKNIFMQMLYDDGQVEKMEYEIYNRWYDEFLEDYRVDAVIYLDSEPTVCAERINRRNRNGEDGIPLAYLEKCRDYHTRWLVDTSTACAPLTDQITQYTIKHENYDYEVLRIDTNTNTKYENENDIGTSWINCIRTQLCDKINNIL